MKQSHKTVERAEMLFACLAEEIAIAHSSHQSARGMTATETEPLTAAPPSVLAYLQRLVRRWHKGDEP